MNFLAIVVFFILTVNSSKLNSECKGDSSSPNFVIEIPHPDEKTANLLHLHSGSCDQTNFKQFGGSSVYHVDSSTIEITIPILACDLKNSVYGFPVTSKPGSMDNDFGLYMPKANITIGNMLNGREIVFKNVLVTAECGVKTTYRVGFEYIEVTTAEGPDNCQKIDGKCVFPSFDESVVFEIKEYTDNNFLTKVTSENRAKIAGQPVYFSLRATSINDDYKFAVTDCSVVTRVDTRVPPDYPRPPKNDPPKFCLPKFEKPPPNPPNPPFSELLSITPAISPRGFPP